MFVKNPCRSLLKTWNHCSACGSTLPDSWLSFKFTLEFCKEMYAGMVKLHWGQSARTSVGVLRVYKNRCDALSWAPGQCQVLRLQGRAEESWWPQARGSASRRLLAVKAMEFEVALPHVLSACFSDFTFGSFFCASGSEPFIMHSPQELKKHQTWAAINQELSTLPSPFPLPEVGNNPLSIRIVYWSLEEVWLAKVGFSVLGLVACAFASLETGSYPTTPSCLTHERKMRAEPKDKRTGAEADRR